MTEHYTHIHTYTHPYISELNAQNSQAQLESEARVVDRWQRLGEKGVEVK